MPSVTLLDLPTEIHHKIKEFLGPKHALIPAHTCRTLFTIYGHDHIWENWLQTEYQQPPLKQLSSDKFTFTTRKIYELKVENDKGYFFSEIEYFILDMFLRIRKLFPRRDISDFDDVSVDQQRQSSSGCRLSESTIQLMMNSLISQNVVNQQDACLLLESEIIDFCLKISQPNINKLYSDNYLSLNDVQHLTRIQLERLHEDPITTLFLKGSLSLKEIENLTDSQFNRLCQPDLNWLYVNELLSLNDINVLPDNQINKLEEYNIYRAFIAKLLSLEDIKNLTATQIKRFKIETICILFVDKLLSLQDLENLTDPQMEKLCDPAVEQRFRNGQLTLDELEAYTYAVSS